MYTLPSDFASLENVFTLVFLLNDLARRNSLHQITLAESYFKLDLENFQHDFWIFVHASVIVDQDHLWKVLTRQTWLISSW